LIKVKSISKAIAGFMRGTMLKCFKSDSESLMMMKRIGIFNCFRKGVIYQILD